LFASIGVRVKILLFVKKLHSALTTAAAAAAATAAAAPVHQALSTDLQHYAAGFAGYVQFSVTSITSGLAPLSALAETNSTQLDSCIFPGTGPMTPIFAGSLVRQFAF